MCTTKSQVLVHLLSTGIATYHWERNPMVQVFPGTARACGVGNHDNACCGRSRGKVSGVAFPSHSPQSFFCISKSVHTIIWE